MKLWKTFWSDEAGLVMSAELVMLGTVGVIGATVGLSAASTAINDEMIEFSQAIRSLDQSYEIQGHKSCRAWSAGSSYRQQDVAVSLAELCGQIEAAETEEQKAVKRQAPPKSKELRKKLNEKKKKAQQKKNKKKNEA